MKEKSGIAFFFTSLLIYGTLANSAASDTCTLSYNVIKPINGTPIISWEDAEKLSLGKTISTTLAQDTYTPASFVVKSNSGTACNNVSFKTSPLYLENSNTINLPGDSLRIQYVKKWYQAGTAWTDIGAVGPRKLTPELLLNDPDLIKVDYNTQHNFLKVKAGAGFNLVDISSSTPQYEDRQVIPISSLNVEDSLNTLPIALTEPAQQIWLTISTPSSIPGGKYKGTIKAQQNGQDIAQIPIEVTVLPFKLPPPQIEYSIFYRSQLNDQGSISAEWKNAKQYEAELADMKRHGISNPNVYQSKDFPIFFDQAIALRKKTGFTDTRLYYLGISAGTANTLLAIDNLNRSIKSLKSKFDPLGYSDLYLYAIDEAKKDEQKKQLGSWQVVHTANTKIFATGAVGTYDNIGSALDTLVLAGKPDKLEIEKFHSSGKRVLTYAYPQTGPENPFLFRKRYGIALWASGIDGAMPYAYMDSAGAIWNDFDHPVYRDHCFAYPTATGVIGTIAWEGFHEAVEDVRYLTLLNQKIAEADKRGCEKNISCPKAKQYVAQLQQNPELEDLDIIRTKLVSFIVELNASLAPPQPPALNSVQ